MKEYIKPELEVISLVTDEAITGEIIENIGSRPSGEVGLEPNPFV